MDEKKSPTSLLNNQSGQGIIEYLLVLTVTVLVILGVTYQFNKAFQVWANNYFGEYLACLLETGELPSLGATNATGLCQAEFKPFSLAEGRPLIEAGQGGATSGGFTPTKRGRNSRSISGGGGSAHSYVGHSSFTRSPRRFQATRSRAPNATASSISGASDNNDDISRLNSGGSDLNRRKLIRVKKKKFINRGGAGDFDDEDKKQKLKNKDKTPAEKSLNRHELIKVKPNKKLKKLKIDEDEEFEFGSFIRFLIIAAIIIALILLLGGQALQISKSME